MCVYERWLLCIITIMMVLLNFLIAIAAFVVLYLVERLVMMWLKKKAFWPLISWSLLVEAIAYTAFSFLLIGVIHLVFKKIDSLGLVFLDIAIYSFIKLINPSKAFFAIKNKEKVKVDSHHILGYGFLLVILLECFVFNMPAYSSNKNTVNYTNFVCEDIKSEGNIQSNKISLANKQCIYIDTHHNNYDSIYLSFDNSDMNLYINIFELRDGSIEYDFKKYALVDPKIDSLGYISLNDMDKVSSLKIEFDIDDSRYLDNLSKPTVVVDSISFDSYFPMTVNPIRLGGCLLLLVVGLNFKKLFIDNRVKENQTIFERIERVILFGGAAFFIVFIIVALINNSAYFIKYDQLYLGGTSSNNIYYQQFDAYVKGQLHLDVPVDERLAALSNPYDQSKRLTMTVLWDHALYNGKYYSYYGHAPIYLVMLPIYWISGYVPSNLFVLQLGVLFSIFAILLAALKVVELFIKKVSAPLLILTLVSIVFGSLLFTNNTYEYGGMIYRIPYAYANGFLFLTIYLFIKGYNANKFRFLYFIFTGLSLVFIVLSRPLECLYLLLFIPVIIKMIRSNKNVKQSIIDYVPALGIVLVGAVLICVMNYVRFNNILEFGEHYQLTVMDCRNNKLDIDGVLPTLYHFFLQAPKRDRINHLLTYRDAKENFDIHPYNVSSVGLAFVPICLLVLFIPYVLHKEDDISFKIFAIASPFIIFFIAFINYCFAGVCPRYLLDIAPWAALTGGLIAMKALEKDNGKHPVVPVLLVIVLSVNIVLSCQYHFMSFDGLKAGDFYGLYGYIKTIFNQFSI